MEEMPHLPLSTLVAREGDLERDAASHRLSEREKERATVHGFK
jgi:hypothetical protein